MEQRRRHAAPVGAHVAQAQQGHHMAQVQQLVEVGAADVDAGGGEDVAATVGKHRTVGADTGHGEVGSAATNVDHQHGAFCRDALFVVKRGGNRLQLELHGRETRRIRCLAQGGLRLRIALGVVVHKMHRAAQQGSVHRVAQLAFAAAFQLFEEQHHHFKQADHAAIQQGLFVDEAAAQQAFDGAHQAAFMAFEVRLHGRAAIGHRAVFAGEKQRRGHGGAAFVQLQCVEPPVRADHRGRAVGGAEVDAEEVRVLVLGHVRLGTSPRELCAGRRRCLPPLAGARCGAWGRCASPRCNPGL